MQTIYFTDKPELFVICELGQISFCFTQNNICYYSPFLPLVWCRFIFHHSILSFLQTTSKKSRYSGGDQSRDRSKERGDKSGSKSSHGKSKPPKDKSKEGRKHWAGVSPSQVRGIIVTYSYPTLQILTRDNFLIESSVNSGMGLSDTIKIFLQIFPDRNLFFLSVEISACTMKFEGPLGLSL